MQKVYYQGFYPKQLLTDLVDLAIEIMAMPETSSHFVSNANRILSVIIPSISKLGNSSNAQTNCRLTLYHALTVWQSLENKETVEATQAIDASSFQAPKSSPDVLANQVQTQPQLSQGLQIGSATYASQLLSSCVSIPQHQFAIPTGHRPYNP